jgi:protease IV
MNTDAFIDRKQLKQRLIIWQIFAIITTVVLVIFLIGKFDAFKNNDHIAVLNISNIIVDDPNRSKALTDIAKDKLTKALIVHIDSPGGTVVGGEALYLHLREVAEKKPVVAIINDMATSAGYMAALAADQIFARQSSITGSIGVIIQTTDITILLKKLGVKAESIKSAPLKAQPNPLEPMNENIRSATRLVVEDIFNMFIDMVVMRRKMDREEVRQLADGRIYTGRQAVKNGLIDAIGGEKEALEWLSANKNISSQLPLHLISFKRKISFVDKILDWPLGNISISDRLGLDGLVSLWQPDFR